MDMRKLCGKMSACGFLSCGSDGEDELEREREHSNTAIRRFGFGKRYYDLIMWTEEATNCFDVGISYLMVDSG